MKILLHTCCGPCAYPFNLKDGFGLGGANDGRKIFNFALFKSE